MQPGVTTVYLVRLNTILIEGLNLANSLMEDDLLYRTDIQYMATVAFHYMAAEINFYHTSLSIRSIYFYKKSGVYTAFRPAKRRRREEPSTRK